MFAAEDTRIECYCLVCSKNVGPRVRARESDGGYEWLYFSCISESTELDSVLICQTDLNKCVCNQCGIKEVVGFVQPVWDRTSFRLARFALSTEDPGTSCSPVVSTYPINDKKRVR